MDRTSGMTHVRGGSGNTNVGLCDAPATRVMSAPWELIWPFDHKTNDRSSLGYPHQHQSQHLSDNVNTEPPTRHGAHA
jgi:hypothetical protein|eukprot:7389124-Prymnesium_polylepis.3